MAHLTPVQFVDIVDGTVAESDVPHISVCDACRQELLEMRAMMTEAAAVDVPEPSPLFWGRLSSRVHDAMANDAARPRSWAEQLFQPRVLVPIFASVVAVVMFVALHVPNALFRQMSPVAALSPIPTVPLPTTERAVVPALAISLPPLGAADDPKLGLVADYGTTFDWDEMRDEMAASATSTLSTSGTSSDAVLNSLTVDEQRELQRLLADEMAQPPVPENRS